VYWLQGPKFAGWGSLAPGEDWTPATRPQQFLNANTTYAQFRAGARAIDPAGFQDRPKDPLGAAVFALALPSPAFPTARLEAVRPVLRVGSTRVVPVVPGAAYQDGPISGVGQSPDDSPVSVLTNPGSSDPPLVVVTQPPPDLPPLQPPQSPDVYYPAPVYTGIIVVNPPERPDGPTYRRPNPSQPPKNPIAQNPPATPTPQPGQPTPAPGHPTTPGKPPEPVTGGNPPPHHPEPRPKPLPEPPARPAPAPAPPPPAAPVTAKPTPAPAPAPASPPPSTETKVAPPSPVKN
jgi:hypothetical protein